MPARLGTSKRRILFVCIENSSRSVMAEGFARDLELDASSAGTVPATQVNPLVVEAMKEVGIDVSQSKPKELTDSMIDDSDLVVLTDASLEKAIPRPFMKKMKKKDCTMVSARPSGKAIVRDKIRKGPDQGHG